MDLYELTMAAAYFEHRIDCRATFELFVRHLPKTRTYLVAAGLEAALDYLENLRFTLTDVAFLRQQPAFKTVSSQFFDYLLDFRFSGDVQAVEEGSLVFAEEPILQVTAPVLEAQIVDTLASPAWVLTRSLRHRSMTRFLIAVKSQAPKLSTEDRASRFDKARKTTSWRTSSASSKSRVAFAAQARSLGRSFL